jgi:hypothetical protein
MEIYLLIHFMSFFICLGFALQKAESPYVDDTFSWWAFTLVLYLVIAPVSLLICIGSSLHGSN